MESKQIAIIAVVIVAVAAIAAAFVLTQGSHNDEPGEITDAYGNVIKLDKVPERIVSTTVTATENICDLGLRANLVGVSLNSHVYEVTTKVTGVPLTFDYPATIEADIESGKLASVGTSNKWTAETVAKCNPELVVMEMNQISTAETLARMTQLQSLGITCCVLSSENTWEDINSNITLLGELFGKQTRAKEITSAANHADKTIRDAVGKVSGLRVAHICFCWGTYYIYNESGPMNVMLNLGCTNALPTTSSFATITTEAILEANPDLIIFDDMATNLNWTDVIAEWKADDIMGNVSAIKNNNFYCMEYQPFQATSYTTIHYVMGEAIVATAVAHEKLGIDLPNIITSAKWVDYISWLDEKI